MTPALSIVIPIKNGADFLPDLLNALRQQEGVSPFELILLDSCSVDQSIPLAREHWPEVRLERIESFSHGGTRNRGVELASGPLVVLMTQDALPAAATWLSALIRPLLDDESIAASYSRQIPRPDAPPLEKHHIATQFPEGPPHVKRCPPGETPAPDMCFLSNVSSAYRRDLLLQHPFDPDLLMGEDQQAARDFLMAGYGIAYAPDSPVLHSHAYTPAQTFRRYFDSAVANKTLFPPGTVRTHNREALSGHFRRVSALLRKNPAMFPRLLADTLLKSAAVFLGHHHRRLPPSLCTKLSMHAYHWRRPPAR